MMVTNLNRKRLTIAFAALVVIVLAALAYGYRDRMAGMPLVGALFAVDESAEGQPAQAHGTAPAPSAPGPAAMDPRAEVNLDLRRQQLIGVRTSAVERGPAATTLRAVGLVRYDETRLADVNLKLEGWIRDLYVDYTGKLVQQGDPLFTLYSPELLTTQQEYLLALKSRDQLRSSQIADARDYADRLVEAARQRILLWDLPADQIAALDESGEAPAVVTFRSPVTGYVIEKHALQGLHVTPGQTLYRIADLSRVWIEADVYEQDVSLARVGRSAAVTLDAYPGERFDATVTYVYPYVEEKTRTVRVRFELANRAGRLKPGMYANVELQAPLGMSTTIPSNALLDSGARQLVFVAEGDGYFQPREVKAGQRLDDRVQILEGLREGEQVAMGATFFLDSESQLRASVQAFGPPPAMAGGEAAVERLDIGFTSEPDPPRTGDNLLEVSVKDAAGQPIADAEVSVTFFMAAMPTMNMPAMRNEVRLPPAGGGIYRGSGQVMMGGRWDVTVNVTKNGQRLGSRQFAVVAR
jgi:Cu(I)/Ag(I) efflux system membrane fusion protein/cobalt-zinc-cadmium efflux system membrane fusion protein